MSPAAQRLFMTEIAPILMATVPRVVTPVGSEDSDELIQDALAEACRATDTLERRGKSILPSSVAHYTLQRLKTGRRSTSGGRTDALSPGCQLDGHASLMSLDAPLQDSEDEGEPLTLGDVLSDKRDDPSRAATRNLDWDAFTQKLNPPQQYVVSATAAGVRGVDQARHLGVTQARVVQHKRAIAGEAQDFWGPGVLQGAAARPLWWKTRRA